MTVQLELPTAIAQGQAQAVACLEKTRQEVNDWPERALAALQLFINQQKIYGRGELFTSEEAVAYAYDHGLPHAHDDRAFGALFVKLVRSGQITQSTELYRRTKGHGSVALKWKIVG